MSENQLATRPSNTVATYDKVGDPLAYSEKMGSALESLCGAPVGQGVAIAMTALCEGLTPMQLQRRYHFIAGKPSMRADAMLAEFRMNHGGEYEVIERTPERAAIKFTDRLGNVHECELTLEQLHDSRWPWKKWNVPPEQREYKDNYGTPLDRRNMLWARCVSDSMRFICPEMVAGVYTPEEVGDFGSGDQVVEQPPRPTVDQLLANSAANDGDVVDASFTVVPDEVAEQPPIDQSSPGSILERQEQRINELFDLLSVSPENRQAALAKRNAQVVKNLSAEDAQGLIDRMEAKAKEAAGE